MGQIEDAIRDHQNTCRNGQRWTVGILVTVLVCLIAVFGGAWANLSASVYEVREQSSGDRATQKQMLEALREIKQELRDMRTLREKGNHP